MHFFRGKPVKNGDLHFFAVWKKRGKSFFLTVFPHICGEKKNLRCREGFALY
jgi:hypothetical protein